MTDTRPAPYPADTRAKGWRFELDYEQIEQSDTWDIAGEIPMAQHALLMMWLVAWRQDPCGSLPNDESVIRAKCRIPAAVWDSVRSVCMRGWWLADDGRMYHDTISARVLEMLEYRRKNAQRVAKFKAAKRDSHAGNALPDGEQQGSNDTGTGTGSTSLSSPSGKKEKPARKRAAAPQLVTVDDMVAEGVDRQHATDWLVNRKTKGLAPLTPTIWSDTKAEAVKAGLPLGSAIKAAAAEGWGGFKATWLDAETKAPKANHRTSRHAGFDTKDYREGVTEDGHIA